MQDTADYLVHEHLESGLTIEIRSLRLEDEANLLAAIRQSSSESLRRRFFSAKRDFSEKEISHFMATDAQNHVALVALARENDNVKIVGGGRYIASGNAEAEMAFMVVDDWQGQGIGSMLLRHLIKIARHVRLRKLTAEVMPENIAMLKVFEKYGFERAAQQYPDAISLALSL